MMRDPKLRNRSWDELLGSTREDRRRLLPGILVLAVVEAVVLVAVAVVVVQRFTSG